MTFKDLYLLTYKNKKPFESSKNLGELFFAIVLKHLISQDIEQSGDVGIIDLYCYNIYKMGLKLIDLEIAFKMGEKNYKEGTKADALLFDFFNKDQLFDESREVIKNMPSYLLKNIGLTKFRKNTINVGELKSSSCHVLFMFPKNFKEYYTKVAYALNSNMQDLRNNEYAIKNELMFSQIELLESKYNLGEFIKNYLESNSITADDIFESRIVLLEGFESALKTAITNKLQEEIKEKQDIDSEIKENENRIKNLNIIDGCVIGQEDAITTIKNKLRSSFVGFRNENQPTASFLLTGPTGVGKTETAKAVADACYSGKLFVVDMSTFKHKSDVNRLLGSAPGYVGYGDTNQFCDFIKNNPHSVILFDEIEKADSECLDLLMRILDEGQFISATNEVIDLRNTVIFCTTNITQNKQREIGFGASVPTTESVVTDGGLKKEHVGRYSNVLEYKKLTKSDCEKIVKTKFINQILNSFKKRDINNLSIEVNENLISEIVEDANINLLGARDLKKSIQKFLIDPVSLYIAEHQPHDVKLIINTDGVVELNVNKINENYNVQKYGEQSLCEK